MNLDLYILGAGNVCSALIDDITNRDFVICNHNVSIKLIANSRKHIYNKRGIGLSDLRLFLNRRVISGQSSNINLTDNLNRKLDNKSIIIDVTASENTTEVLMYGKKLGYNVVLANKKPLVKSQADFNNITKGNTGYRATVGTRLPIISQIKSGEIYAENIEYAYGCFSGSLGYIFQKINEGIPFSEAVEFAHKNKYTEPNPKDDLSGYDVARKLLIVMRTMGYNAEMSDINITPVFPESFNNYSAQEFLSNCKELDISIKEMTEEAKKDSKILKYLAWYKNGKLNTGITAVKADSEIGKQKGSEKLFVYKQKSVETEDKIDATEAGAGPVATAKDIVADIADILQQD